MSLGAHDDKPTARVVVVAPPSPFRGASFSAVSAPQLAQLVFAVALGSTIRHGPPLQLNLQQMLEYVKAIVYGRRAHR